MSIAITQVDAFTDEAFAGNPAAVCVLPTARSERWMQDVAREMNLSETAFLRQRGEEYDLRWFTPAVEVELCGHATLASAHVLWERKLLRAGAPARFHTKSGLLLARQDGDRIELDFPATPPETCAAPPALLQSLGAAPRYVGRSRFDYLIEVQSEREVRELAPDFGRLKTLGVRGVMVTAVASSPPFDFVSRFFAPGAGVDEDPVTGSAHCCLGPYWAERLGKRELAAYQASSRGGRLFLRIDGERVRLAGHAVTVLRGELVGAAAGDDSATG